MNSKLEIRTGTVIKTKRTYLTFEHKDDKGRITKEKSYGNCMRNAVFYKSGITYEAVQVEWYNTREVTKWCNGTLAFRIITPDIKKRHSLGLKFSSYATINDYIVRYSDGNYEVISDTDFQDLINMGVLIEN